MAKKKVVKKAVKPIEVVAVKELSVEDKNEADVLGYLKGKGIVDRYCLNVGVLGVDEVVDRLVGRGLIGISGNRIWLK